MATTKIETWRDLKNALNEIDELSPALDEKVIMWGDGINATAGSILELDEDWKAFSGENFCEGSTFDKSVQENYKEEDYDPEDIDVLEKGTLLLQIDMWAESAL